MLVRDAALVDIGGYSGNGSVVLSRVEVALADRC
jgi:hypothetical protein